MSLNSINPGTSFPFKLALVQTPPCLALRTRTCAVPAHRTSAHLARVSPLRVLWVSPSRLAKHTQRRSERSHLKTPVSQIREDTHLNLRFVRKHTHTMSAINVTQVQVLVRVFWVSRHAPVVVSLPIG